MVVSVLFFIQRLNFFFALLYSIMTQKVSRKTTNSNIDSQLLPQYTLSLLLEMLEMLKALENSIIFLTLVLYVETHKCLWFWLNVFGGELELKTTSSHK